MGDPWLVSSAGGPILAAVLDGMVCNAVGWRCGRARAVSGSYSERWKARQSHQRSLRSSPYERRISGASSCDASLSLPGERNAFALAGNCRRRSVPAGSWRGRRAVLATLLARGEVRCGGVVPLTSETRTRDGEPAAASPGTRRAALSRVVALDFARLQPGWL